MRGSGNFLVPERLPDGPIVSPRVFEGLADTLGILSESRAGDVSEPHTELRRELDSLLAEQRRTNRLLQAIVYGGLGFLLGLIVMQVLVRVRLW